jgi:hypothetical protein
VNEQAEKELRDFFRAEGVPERQLDATVDFLQEKAERVAQEVVDARPPPTPMPPGGVLESEKYGTKTHWKFGYSWKVNILAALGTVFLVAFLLACEFSPVFLSWVIATGIGGLACGICLAFFCVIRYFIGEYIE